MRASRRPSSCSPSRPKSAIPTLLEREIVPTVTTREFAVALGKWAAARGTEAPFHLKIDTGMNRIGVRAEDAAAFARNLADFPGSRSEGTFTHLATADVAGDWEVTRQLQRFETALAEMRTEGVDPGIVHAANSPATILYPEAHYDMVRCGIAIYGLQPSQATERVDRPDARDGGQGAGDAGQAHRHGRKRQLRLHVDGLRPDRGRDAAARLRRRRAPRRCPTGWTS